MYRSTKRYGHELGLTACFRQWRAQSHCHFLHGYPLAFEFTFEVAELDERGWVVDFGALKKLKEDLVSTFDHKLLISRDDPQYAKLVELGRWGLADVRVLDRIGIEAFAEVGYYLAQSALIVARPDARVVSVQCWEHAGNSAIYSEESK